MIPLHVCKASIIIVYDLSNIYKYIYTGIFYVSLTLKTTLQSNTYIYTKYQELWCMYGKQIIPYLKQAETEMFHTSGFLPRFWNTCLNFASYTPLLWKPEIYNALKSKSLHYRVKIFEIKDLVPYQV